MSPHNSQQLSWNAEPAAVNREGSLWLTLGYYLIGVGGLAVLYYLAGKLGLAVESVQPGVSPIWPASGVALIAFLRFGIRLWPGVILGMVLLALDATIPLPAALPAAIGSILEAAIPVLLLRRFGFTGDFSRVTDVLLFTGIAVLIGPVFSATAGTLGMVYFCGNSQLDATNIWMVWWLGNGFGSLVVAGFVLAWFPGSRYRYTDLFEILGFILATVAIGYLYLENHPNPTLLWLFLLTPVTVIAALSQGKRAVTLITVVITLIFLSSPNWLDPEIFAQTELGSFYANIVFIAFNAFTGLAVSAARGEYRIQRQISHQATHDGLTGLLNRPEFERRMHLAIGTLVSDKGSRHCLLFVDLDKTKQVNDRAGHPAGDALLQHVADVFTGTVRGVDMVARFGGDEFVVLLVNCPLERAKGVAANICSALAEQPFHWNSSAFSITASIGLLELNGWERRMERLFEMADKACYEAKKAGGNRFVVYGREIQGTGSEQLTSTS